MKSRFAGILLLTCFVAPLATMLLFFQFQKIRAKQIAWSKIQSRVAESDLLLFTFTQHESALLLNWEDDHEFEYQGEMYDVVKTTQKGDTVYYWVFNDHKETTLYRQLEELVSDHLAQCPENQENSKRVLQLLKLFFEPAYIAVLPNALQAESACFDNKSEQLSVPEFSLPDPPPEIG